ncbi:MAG: glycosyltransferase family 2 protein [candidate division Zixibacteria bacterium]|jgi:GT2 family glycosyltransferase|nr:glycosyltransferase family 2 protein [candidate division Zixibacteria bacterium]
MSSDRPEISAVIISYNGMTFLPDCLRTLSEELRGLTHEIIVVDNGSRDGSPEFVERTYPRVTLIRNASNLGFARAVNQGFERGKGEYYYILNQDLRFGHGATARLLERIRQDDTIGMIGPKFIYFGGGTQRSVRSFPTYRHVLYRALFLDRVFPDHPTFGSWRMGFFDHETEAFVDQPMGAVMLIPRRVVDDIGMMDERFPILFNDVDFCRRLADAGYKRLYYPDAVVEHYVGASTSTMPVRIRIISHTSMYRYMRKYARPIELPLLWLCGALLMISIPISIAVNQTRRKLTAAISSFSRR